VLAAQKALIPQLEQQAAQTRNQLAVLLGRPPEGFALSAKSLNNLKVPMVKAGLPSDLLRQRPDIARAEALLLAAGANVEAGRAAFLPSFNLTASGGLESMTLKTLLGPHAAANSLLAGISQPLFDGGTLKAQYQGETAREAETVANSRKTVLTALSDVENALIAVEQSRRQEVLQQEVVTASRRATLISEERLKAGTIDIVTLLAVQQSLFQAQENLLSSRLQRLQSSLGLIEALGGGFQKPADEGDDKPALMLPQKPRDSASLPDTTPPADTP
jgi:NodT family efflux transporter outer membrane factor (OMF) lipoprotein